MKKKYLAYFIPDLISLNAKIISQKFLIEQLCKNFDRLFIINFVLIVNIINNYCFDSKI